MTAKRDGLTLAHVRTRRYRPSHGGSCELHQRGVTLGDGIVQKRQLMAPFDDAVYEGLAGCKPNVVLAFCWSHARRKYKDIQEFFPKDTEKIIELIDKVFEIDRRAPGDDEVSLQQRATAPHAIATDYR